MTGEFARFRGDLTPELGERLSETFVESLWQATGGSIKLCRQYYHRIGASWGPILKGWREWLIREAEYQPYLVQRDAKPLTVLDLSCQWPQIWINRLLCSVDDEISGDHDTSTDPLLYRYLEERGLNKPFTMIDTGCWGTMVKRLTETFGLVIQPLFFYSHNPHIPGYLNVIAGVPDLTLETLNDSLECCFPNLFSRPAKLVVGESGKVKPKLEALGGLSGTLGKAALVGLQEASSVNHVTPEQGLETLLGMYQDAKEGVFTGILPTHTPTWSEGSSFLASWKG